MNNWRTMETAPKDGTPVLGYDGWTMNTIRYVQPYHRVGRGWWALVDGGPYADDVDWFPTHWMPLPPPPKPEVTP